MVRTDSRAHTRHAAGYGVCCCSLRPQGLERAALAVNPNFGGLFQTRRGSRRPVTQPPLLGTPRTPSPAPRGPRQLAPAPPQGPGRRRRAGLAGARQEQRSRLVECLWMRLGCTRQGCQTLSPSPGTRPTSKPVPACPPRPSDGQTWARMARRAAGLMGFH